MLHRVFFGLLDEPDCRVAYAAGGPDQDFVRNGNILDWAQHACKDGGVHQHAKVRWARLQVGLPVVCYILFVRTVCFYVNMASSQ